MKLAIEILNREIAQREHANKHVHSRKEENQKELDSLYKAVKKLILCATADGEMVQPPMVYFKCGNCGKEYKYIMGENCPHCGNDIC